MLLEDPPQRASWSPLFCVGCVEELWSLSTCAVYFSCLAADKEMRNVDLAFPVNPTFVPSGQVGSGDLLQGFLRGVRFHTCACMFVCSAACVEYVYTDVT